MSRIFSRSGYYDRKLMVDGNSGSASPSSGILKILGSGNITTSASGNTVTIFETGSGDLHVARYIVSAGGATGRSQLYNYCVGLCSGCICWRPSGTVFVQPGTYNENITLTAGINLAAFKCDAALTPKCHYQGQAFGFV